MRLFTRSHRDIAARIEFRERSSNVTEHSPTYVNKTSDVTAT